ncbi:MAG: hypothetical protein ICV63_21115, partial [Coleofasciculus sp. Co-bin14]|nr:hypothetical protein [Coleofasciculus sp. Co-bin14]
MNTHRLAFVGRVSLLCLVAGFLPWGAMPAVAETTDTLSLKQPEELSSTEDGLTPKLHSTEPTTNSTGGTVALSNTDGMPQNSTLLSQDQQVKSSNSAVAPISLP